LENALLAVDAERLAATYAADSLRFTLPPCVGIAPALGAQVVVLSPLRIPLSQKFLPLSPGPHPLARPVELQVLRFPEDVFELRIRQLIGTAVGQRAFRRDRLRPRRYC